MRIGEYNGLVVGGGLASTVWTGNNASNFQDTFFTQFSAAAPEIALTESAANVADGGSFSFGTTTAGTPVTKTFTVTNSGTATLNLSALTVPVGFTIAQNFASSTVAANGGTTTFQITMSAAAAGSPSGTLTFTNDDADENPYNFTISGTVSATVTLAKINDGAEPSTNCLFRVTQTATSITNTVVTYAITGTASSGTDFTALSGSVTILAGNITADISVSVIDDNLVEGTESVIASLTGVSGDPQIFLGATVVATVNIADNDTAPEIAVSGNGNNIPDGSLLAAATTTNATDFGSTPVQGGVLEITYTITNSGNAALNLTGGPNFVSVSPTTDFNVTQQPTTPVTISGSTTTFKIAFNPTTAATTSATVTFTNDDADEGSFDFVIKGTGTGPQTFDLAGNPVSNTPFDGGQTYIYSAGPPPPAPVVSASGEGVVTGGNAPDPTGADSGLNFSVVTRSGFIAENGNLAFAAELTGAGVDATNFKGFFKHDGSSLKRLARTGDNAPETGATAAKFSDLPLIPGINDDGQVTLFAQLAPNPASTPATTVDNDTGLWSELGGTGFQILIRESDQIPGLTAGILLGRFGSGCFATAKTGASTGQAAFTVTFKGGSTDSALLRCSIIGADTTAVSVVARENAAAPGVVGESFSLLNSTYTDAVRMDAQGNIAFGTVLKPSGKTSIYYQPVTGGPPVKAMVSGDAAPSTTGATFLALDLPIMGDSGTFSFHGVLNTVGDNAANTKNDGIWRGTVAGGFTNILRRGDSNTNRPGLFANGTIKAGNIYSGWINNSNHGAWLGWVDSAGDGISSYPADTFGIYTDMSGTMKLLISSGDTAPGMPVGATMFYVDHPVVSGKAPNEYLAFLATVTGGGTTAANNKGIWRSLNGAAPTLVLRTGDSMTVTPGGSKVIADIDIPGSNVAEHVWETPVMDSTGRLLVNVSFTDGTTTQVVIP